MKVKDMIGKTLGYLKILRFHHRSKTGIPYVECECTYKGCGKRKIISAWAINKGDIRSCGCLRSETTHNRCFKDLTGRKFHRLTVIRQSPKRDKDGVPLWECKCSCKSKKIVLVRSYSLKTGNTKSCGCIQRELASKLGSSHMIYKTDTDRHLASIYRGMMARCYDERNQSYASYGGRGISICSEWLNDMWKFIEWGREGYKPGLEIDRIDPNGNYCPENCRWLTHRDQQRNKRNNRVIVVDGVKGFLYDWMIRIPAFANWCAKMYRRPKRFKSEYGYEYAFTNEDAAAELARILRDYGNILLGMKDADLHEVADLVLNFPRSLKFLTMRGEKLTVAQWFNKLKPSGISLRDLCKLSEPEIREVLLNCLNRKSNQV